MDPISEGKFTDAIYNCFDNSTVIMIARRLSNIKDFDNIFVLDNGEIVESGTHIELMKIYYVQILRMQELYTESVTVIAILSPNAIWQANTKLKLILHLISIQRRQLCLEQAKHPISSYTVTIRQLNR